MARNCKCKICGTQLNTDIAFKVVVKDKSNYYCDKEEYSKYMAVKEQEKVDKDRMYNAITAILGYPTQNSALWLEHKRWLLLKPNSIIAQYLEENKDYLTSAIARLSGNEYGKIRYLSTILCNSLRDYKPREEEQPKPKVVVEEVMYEAPARTLNKRRSLAELEDDF